MARVVLAMSGGVDSSVAAYLLKKQGHEVIGLFMRTGMHGNIDAAPERKKGCCSALDAGDARRVADLLNIPFYALDFESDFKRIIDYFADEYLAGRTPNPCVVCNNWLKFGKLWEYGRQLEADAIATGHYARIVRTGDKAQLHRGLDPEKDQSYVLHGISRTILDRLLFPIGDYRKDEVRQMAREAGLPISEKPDSVEICFVPENDHAAVIGRLRPDRHTAGRLVDTAGHTLGAHDGIEKFTVGQRKGLGYAAGERRYVLQIVPGVNDVVLGTREELLVPGLVAKEVNWLLDSTPAAPRRCQAKIRYRHTAAAATVTAGPGATARVMFDEPQGAIAPGQAVVFYDDARVLGGGWIDEPLREAGALPLSARGDKAALTL